MRSTFMGLETSKRGLHTQQSALYTTGHNISNANTLGYSRQRVNMEATSGFPGVGLNAGTMPGFLGTGVQAGSITRIRDSFVDQQFRQESNKLGYWEAQSKAISQMEDVLNEPSHYGLQKSLSEFWQSLQDLATNPNESGARAVAVRKGEAVADSFNYMHKSLTEIQTNLGTEIEHTTKDINSILKQIAAVNEQIKAVEPNGYIPNDLYDQRDLLLDDLAELVPIDVEYKHSGGRAVEGEAEGWAVVKLKTEDGPVTLVHGHEAIELEVKFDDNFAGENAPVTGIEITGSLDVDENGDPVDHGLIEHDNLLDSGKLKSLMDAYGVPGDDGVEGLYPGMLDKLDTMANAFMEEFNKIYGGDPDDADYPGGYPLEGNATAPDTFFEGTGAGDLKVLAEIIANPNNFRASDAEDEEGNGKIAQQLADLQFSTAVDLDGATIETYFQSIIGDLGVEGMEANKLVHNTSTLLGAVEHRRASISSVSLDEEMTDMIKFQQAYNASARMITVVDETLDKIINGMGVVGR